ncbi:PilY1 Tfp pilus assembly protein, tip-associated adhesin PilY1 [Methylophilaceae bacterium]
MKNCTILTMLMQLLIAVTITKPAMAAPLTFPQAPIASLDKGSKPNILFILDDSASMLYNYMPEWVGKAPICERPGKSCSTIDPDNNLSVCACSNTDAVFKSSDFNTLYYNPKFLYLPASNAGSSSKISMTSANTTGWTKVPNDAYGVIVNDDYNKNRSSTTNLAAGGFAASYTIMTPGEYCSDIHLTACNIQAGPTTAYPHPAYVRFCMTLDQATSASEPGNVCQATVQHPHKTAFTRYPGRGDVPGSLTTKKIETGKSYTKFPLRKDCLGSGCSYDEEMTNYANWWAYYRTRLQTMKTSTSLAFAALDDNYRVGFNVINNDGLTESDKFLDVGDFNASHKQKFYDSLFNTHPAYNGRLAATNRTYNDKYNHTPLRASLSHAGRYFSKKINGQNFDPMQNACQANFSILSTDGSWNTNDEINQFGPYGLIDDPTTKNPPEVGNVDDGLTVPRPKREGAIFENSMADVAKYYADTDIRNSSLKNCSGANGKDVCGSDSSKQNMSTFTIGLGINGTLIYSNEYKTATSGDFYDITQGTKNWPSSCPSDYCPERVDDLWHAAVNGNGTYFSAQNPEQLKDSLSGALDEIYSRANAGSAAATTTLTPVKDNNSAFITSYVSHEWTGNLESRSIKIDSGKIERERNWCVENIEAVTGTKADGSDALPACPGRMQRNFPNKSSDNRIIYTSVNGVRQLFYYENLSSPQKSYFQSNYLSNSQRLSQWASLTPAQQGKAKEANLVNYLRGQSAFEDRESNVEEDRLFRYREKTLGDITESSPVYVGKPNFNYLDRGYADFKKDNLDRSANVYVGANDGMLHAFEASNGNERWAYIPSMVLPNLWKLADTQYAGKHQNFVNGSITVSDICSSPCSTASDWKTILVGGLNQGGRGFYALNVTDAATPERLWEFNETDMGYSFGNPVITKQKSDGKWVVLLTSGYNNTGVGYLYVLDANSGAVLQKISTKVGTADMQSGLAKISAFVARPSENNQAEFAYGGDLLGNVWRFKIDGAGSASNPLKLASLTSSKAEVQAITARPELGKISGKTVVFIGTGKFLEAPDLKTDAQQTLYAIKDDNVGNFSRADLLSRSMISSDDIRTGTKSDSAFDKEGQKGWYIDLPDSGERQIVAAKLASGTLIVPTMVPSTEACGSNAYGWLNYIMASTGGIVSNTVANRIGTKTNAAPMGINVLYINGKPTLSFTGDNDPTPQLDPNAPFKANTKFSGKRASWRELIR